MSHTLPGGLLSRILKIIDSHGLVFLSIFLLAFIPLYPKLPLLDAIPGYLVKIRLEDVLILITGCWWLVEVWRGKVQWWSSVVLMMGVYAVIGVLSITSGILLLQTIPWEPLHVGKSLLHFFRYLEYFSLFVFLFSALKSLRQVRFVVGLLSVVVAAIVIYALGQLYWEWPVYSTMNREYSKGAALTLGQDARVQSTFAGHYDLSAFLVLLLPYLLIASLTHPRWSTKMWFAAVTLAGAWLLVETGSKFSLFAGLIGLAVTALVYLRRFPRVWLGSVMFGVSCLGLVVVIASLLWFNPSETALSTFESFRQSRVVTKVSPLAKGLEKFSELLVDGQSAAPTEPITEGQPQWSENTLKYGLSMGIRLDTLWPQALRGLAQNLMFGSGYGTLNKTGNSMFVEADSTDNNLLRTAGETGLLGFISFYGIVWLVLRTAWLIRPQRSWVTDTVKLGLIGAVVGIILNGLMIDVFVASKVAFTFWGLTGLTLKALYLADRSGFSGLEQARWLSLRQWFSHWWPLLMAGVFLILVLHRNPFIQTGQIANLSVDPTTAQTLTTVRCWVDDLTRTDCLSEAGVLTPQTYLYALYLAVFYSTWQPIGVYYYANLMLAIIALFAIFKVGRLVFKRSIDVLILCLLVVGGLFVSQIVFIPSQKNLVFMMLTGVLYASVWAWKRYQGTQAKWALPMHLQPVVLPLTISLAAVIVASTPSLNTHLQTMLKEYRATSRYWGVQSVRVLNDYFEGIATDGDSETKSPTVITAINQDFIEFYRKYPFISTQLNEFTSIPQMNQESAESIYLTNAALETDTLREAFLNIRTQFDIDLVAEGCEDVCNVYQVNQEPSTLSINILPDKTAYSFMIINQVFSPDQPASLLLLKNQLIQLVESGHSPDFVIALADQTPTEEILLEIASDTSQVPVFFVKGSTSLVQESPFMSLRTPHDLFLFLYSNYDGQLTEAQQFQHLNALVDVELDSDVQNIFILSDRLQWLEDQPGLHPLSQFTERTTLPVERSSQRQQLLAYLRKTQADHVYFIGGDFGKAPADSPALFYEQDVQAQTTYISSAVRWRPSDVFLSFDIDEAGSATIEAISRQDFAPLSVENFGTQHWAEVLPELTMQSKVAEDIESSMTTRYLLLVGGVAGVWIVAFAWHRTPKLRTSLVDGASRLLTAQMPTR